MHDSAVDIVQLNSNGKVDANGGEASQSALPFSQLYMTFEHGAHAVTRTLLLCICSCPNCWCIPQIMLSRIGSWQSAGVLRFHRECGHCAGM